MNLLCTCIAYLKYLMDTKVHIIVRFTAGSQVNVQMPMYYYVCMSITDMITAYRYVIKYDYTAPTVEFVCQWPSFMYLTRRDD